MRGQLRWSVLRRQGARPGPARAAALHAAGAALAAHPCPDSLASSHHQLLTWATLSQAGAGEPGPWQGLIDIAAGREAAGTHPHGGRQWRPARLLHRCAPTALPHLTAAGCFSIGCCERLIVSACCSAATAADPFSPGAGGETRAHGGPASHLPHLLFRARPAPPRCAAHSMGARLVFHCLLELCRLNCRGEHWVWGGATCRKGLGLEGGEGRGGWGGFQGGAGLGGTFCVPWHGRLPLVWEKPL